MRTQLSIVLLALLAACSQKNPCDDYVDAICECSPDTCEEVTTTYENADADLQDVCSETLTDAQAGNDASCESSDDTGEAG
jgi:hypothetical protein